MSIPGTFNTRETVALRPYKTEFVGPYQQENIEGAIYLWNEKNASDNPAWWPERYDYLHTLCKTGRR